MALLAVYLLLIALLAVDADSDCDSFAYGTLCPLTNPSDIIWAMPDLDNEINCQDECRETTGCNFFMFIRFVTDNSECFLLRGCDTNSNTTSSCSDDPSCKMAVSGPANPSITDSCCAQFYGVACEDQFEVGHEFNDFGEEACQELCRDELMCNYWTLAGEVCFMYSECGTTQPCTSCTSGSSFPSISTCSAQSMEHTLLLGGMVPGDDASPTMEMITSSLVCTPDMPPLPVGRYEAAAALLHSKIFYCGGYNTEDSPTIHSSCHSFLLGQHSTGWEQEESMRLARAYFSLTAIGDKLYAIGGRGNENKRAVAHNTIESFNQQDGWKIEDEMELPSTREGHCSAAVEHKIFIIGGRVGGSTDDSVMAFDTTASSGWVSRRSMLEARTYHGCHGGQYEQADGIYVAGGYNTAFLAAVEFYSVDMDIWRILKPMTSARAYHSLTLVNGQIVAAGGSSLMATVETFNQTEGWQQTNDLQTGREDQAALSFPAGMLSCKTV